MTRRSVIAVPKFERFFRTVAGLDVDKQDLERYGDFVNQKVCDLLIRAQAAAKANGRDIIEPFDLPMAKGLQESSHEFARVDAEVGLAADLAKLVTRRPTDATLGDETEAQLPEVAGGISVALARAFKLIDPRLKNPATEHWERAFHIFDLLL